MSLRPVVPLFAIPFVLATTAFPAPGLTADRGFLASLEGDWNGRGTVLTKIDARPINVSCGFIMRGSNSTLSMNGSCRGLLVVRRSISANLSMSGRGYSGTYVGPSGQASSLSGSQRGNRINLSVHWAKIVNGDRSATMTIEKISGNRLRLRTIDKDLVTGKPVITSSIDLSR